LVAQALRVLLADQILRLDVDWEHGLSPFEVKYLDIEQSGR
jgi:hypothetical protein